MKLNPTATPCVGICSTIYGDNICRGCKRTYTEVIDWNGYADTQKTELLSRLSTQIHTLTQTYLTVTDARLLQQKCDRFDVNYREHETPYCWAYALLRDGADKIKDLAKYGITAHENYGTLTPEKLFEHLDDDLYTKS
jgi:predicted Fe-S protein YdhL (DUF1289 family)